jgi:hypothetical protein
VVAVTYLGSFTKLMAADLASLRSLAVSKAFNSVQTASVNQHVSAIFTAYLGLEDALHGCEPTVVLVQRVEALRAKATTTLDDLLYAMATDAKTQQDAAVSLFGLLPEVLALSEAGKKVGDNLGLDSQVAQVPEGAGEPIGKLAPLPTLKPLPTPAPTPKPTPPPKALAMKASFFGSGVKISTYKVTGSTPSAISSSMSAKGPYSKWLKGRAEALTKMVPAYRFNSTSDYYGGCQIVIEEKPAISLSYTIVLPRWSPPSGTTADTISVCRTSLWWR